MLLNFIVYMFAKLNLFLIQWQFKIVVYHTGTLTLNSATGSGYMYTE